MTNQDNLDIFQDLEASQETAEIQFILDQATNESAPAQDRDCTGCPAWSAFQDNARAYPCDGCKYAYPEYSGDFDPFEDGAE